MVEPLGEASPTGGIVSEQQDISGLRQSLDDVDSGIVHLIARRSGIIAAIAQAKEQGTAQIQDADRERAVLAGVEAVAADLGVSASLVRRIFRELLSDSVAQQARHLTAEDGGRVRVAFQGAAHAYSDAAAQKYLAGRGLDGDLTGYRTFREAAAALLAGDADLAVLPIENTTAGSINEVYALLREHELSHRGRGDRGRSTTAWPPSPTCPLSALRRILSHPQGARAVRAVPASSLPQVRSPRAPSTPREAMRAVAEAEDPTAAAIGSPEAAAPTAWSCCGSNIGDSDDNPTPGSWSCRARRSPVDVRIPCKTSLILVDPAREGRAAALPADAGRVRSLADQAGVAAASRPAVGVHVLHRLRGQRRRSARPPPRWTTLRVGRAVHQGARLLPGQGDCAHGRAAGELRPARPAESPADATEAVAAAAAQAGRARVQALQAGRPGRPAGRHHRPRRRRAHRRRRLRGHGGPVLGRVGASRSRRPRARFVRDAGAHVLRGGVFKPRTSPYAFQGLGWEGWTCWPRPARRRACPSSPR